MPFSDTAKILILQTQSGLTTFPKQTLTPMALQTTYVGDCLAIVIYSPSQGVAYLGHLYLAEMTGDKFTTYKASFDEIIKTHSLNNENTFLALVGGQERTNVHTTTQLDDEKLKNEIHGVKAFQAYFSPHFPSMTTLTGGPEYLERSVELTSNKLHVIEIDFSESGKRKLKRYEFDITAENMQKAEKILSATHYIAGSPSEMETEKVNQINDALSNTEKLKALDEELNDSAEIGKRCFFIGITSNPRYLSGATVRNLSVLFKDTNTVTVSSEIYNCVIFKSRLFARILSHLPLEKTYGLSREQINLFRHQFIQKKIEDGGILADDIATGKTLRVSIPPEKEEADLSPLGTPKHLVCSIL